MEELEELFQIGGPIILEELPQDADMDESEELHELFVSECLKPIFVKVPLGDIFAEGLISFCGADVNAVCCPKTPSKTKTSTQPPDGS